MAPVSCETRPLRRSRRPTCWEATVPPPRSRSFQRRARQRSRLEESDLRGGDAKLTVPSAVTTAAATPGRRGAPAQARARRCGQTGAGRVVSSHCRALVTVELEEAAPLRSRCPIGGDRPRIARVPRLAAALPRYLRSRCQRLQGLLRDPRRPADGDREGDPRGFPQARSHAPPRRQPGRQGSRGAVQGDQRGQRGARRSREAQEVRRARAPLAGIRAVGASR